MKQSEYWNECKDIARGILEECKGDRECVYDALREAVDSHQWIIYTHYNLEVLQHSNNSDAYFDNFGALTADSFANAVQQMAFAAMLADVEEELK